MRISGTKARQDGLYLIFLGASILFLLVTYLVIAPTRDAFKDFEPSYFAARSLIQGRDPYNQSDVLRVYRREGGEHPNESATAREIATRYLYPPTTLAFMVPFAILPFKIARIVWMLLSTGSFLSAAILAWDLAADYAPILSGAVVAFLLANSLSITALSNPTQVDIALCVIAVWCFLRERFIPAGILCFALSLAIKPPDPGMLWLYFLLAGGTYRKRAIHTLLVTAAISLPLVVWVWHAAPNWFGELHSNLLSFAVPGGITDPSPAATGPHTMINLQVVLSWLRDDPRFYNSSSYLIVAIPLILWAFLTLRSRVSYEKSLMAIAAIVPLSMLPLYHQLYCTKLLLLTIPALGILWLEGGLVKWIAFAIQVTALLFTGDIPIAIYRYLIRITIGNSTPAAEQTSKAMVVFPTPIILLIMAIFYLWVYKRHASRHELPAAQSSNHATIAAAQPQTPVQG